MTQKEKPLVEIQIDQGKFQLPLEKYHQEAVTDKLINRINNEYAAFQMIKEKIDMRYSKYRKLLLIIESQYLYLMEQCLSTYSRNLHNSHSTTMYEEFNAEDEQLLEYLDISKETAKYIMENYPIIIKKK